MFIFCFAVMAHIKKYWGRLRDVNSFVSLDYSEYLEQAAISKVNSISFPGRRTFKVI